MKSLLSLLTLVCVFHGSLRGQCPTYPEFLASLPEWNTPLTILDYVETVDELPGWSLSRNGYSIPMSSAPMMTDLGDMVIDEELFFTIRHWGNDCLATQVMTSVESGMLLVEGTIPIDPYTEEVEYRYVPSVPGNATIAISLHDAATNEVLHVGSLGLFVKDLFDLTVQVGSGVEGNPILGGTFVEGTTIDYDYSAAECHGNLGVTLNGVAFPSAGSFVMDDHHLLTVGADITQYVVSVFSGEGGSTDKDGNTLVDCYGSLTITAQAESCFDFGGWSGDATGNVNPLLVDDITSDLTVHAGFTVKNYAVTVSSAPGGTTDHDGVTTVACGDNLTITPFPDPYYDFIQWTGDIITADDPLQLTNITGPITVSPIFIDDAADAVFQSIADGFPKAANPVAGFSPLDGSNTYLGYDPETNEFQFLGEVLHRDGETEESVRAWAITILLIVDPTGNYDGDGGTNEADTFPVDQDRHRKVYVNQFYEVYDGVPKRFIFAGGLKVATDTHVPGSANPGVFFHHADHLSGANVDTNESGEIVEVVDYFPFGDVRLDEQFEDYENDYKFTGKELDSDTNLYYYEARYYDPSIGRFLSIDPWFGDITDPQSLNKYAYVRNNPLKYVDPTGQFIETLWDAANVVADAASAAYHLGGIIGGGVAYAVGSATNNQYLKDAAVEGIKDSAVGLGTAAVDAAADAAATALPLVPAGSTKALRNADNAANSIKVAERAKPDFIVTPDGVSLPTNKDLNLVDTQTPVGQGGEFLQIHTQKPHYPYNNPHAHYSEIHTSPNGASSTVRRDGDLTPEIINRADQGLRNGTLRERSSRQDRGGSK